MKDTFTLEVALPSGRRVTVTVMRKQVKNLNLRVRSDGTLAMSMPRRMSEARARDFLARHAAWMEARLERIKAGRMRAQDGTIPLWGHLVDAAAIADIDALYKREVERTLPAVAARLEAQMGVHALGWQVRRMKTRWGSCTPGKRTIRINAALAAYPPSCLEAVVAHELVHLLEPTHNARFHRLLDAYCPENRELHALLRQPAREAAR